MLKMHFGIFSKKKVVNFLIKIPWHNQETKHSRKKYELSSVNCVTYFSGALKVIAYGGIHAIE